MKTEKLKLTQPKVSKLYNQGKPKVGFTTEETGDPSTTDTLSISTTHIFKV